MTSPSRPHPEEITTSPSENLAPFNLNDGRRLPGLGLGTFAMTGPAGTRSILHALDVGYRLLDTASGYRNEREVGAALRETSVPRDDVVVTSKLRGPDHGRALDAARESRERLGGDPIDLFLIHWPNPRLGLYVEAWRGLVQAQAEGHVRSIGVSNFERAHLEAIIEATGVVPAVNQIELHPYFPQPALRELDTRLGICTQSWSPLGLSRVLTEPVLAEIGAEHGASPAQVVLRWHHQLECLPVPRSADPHRQTENFALTGFALTQDEMARITSLGRRGAPRHGRLWGGDPATEER